MKLIFALGHPAHFHLFKHVIYKLRDNGHTIKIVISDKDILKTLLAANNLDFESIAPRKPNESLLQKGNKIIKSSIFLRNIVNEYCPDLIIGCLSQIAFATFFTGIPSIFFGEDDINYTLIQGIITYPFVSCIVAPELTKVSIFRGKKIGYQGYQKLAYLHPKQFNTKLIPEEYSSILQKPFSLIRLADLNAYHDIKAGGISLEILDKIIKLLEPSGAIYITSEYKLPEKYIKYELPIKPNDIHIALANALLFIGDSQSMAVEASMLGTPSIRFNTFAGRISILEELEHKYGLTFGIKSTEPVHLYKKINELVSIPNIKELFKKRRERMLNDKVDVTAFIVWFIENYPQSAKIMKENPDYQYNFK